MPYRTYIRRPLWVLAVGLLLCAMGSVAQAADQADGTQQRPEIEAEGARMDERELQQLRGNTHKVLLALIRELAKQSREQALRILDTVGATEFDLIARLGQGDDEFEQLLSEVQRNVTSSLSEITGDVVEHLHEAEDDIKADLRHYHEHIQQDITHGTALLSSQLGPSTALLDHAITSTGAQVKGELVHEVGASARLLQQRVDSTEDRLSDALHCAVDRLTDEVGDTQTSIQAKLQQAQRDLQTDVEHTRCELSADVSLTGERLSNMVTRTRDRLEHSVELGQNELTTQLGCASDLLNRQLQDQKTNLNLNLVRAELSLSQDITQGAESCSREVIESKTQLSQAIEALRSDVLQEVTRIAAQSQLIRSEIAFIQGQSNAANLVNNASGSGFNGLYGAYGVEYLGAGYDVFKGNPRGDMQGSPDPGYRAQAVQLIFVSNPTEQGDCPDGLNLCPQGATIRGQPECNYEATMTQHDTTGQYTRDLANELSIDASVALGPITSYFSLSAGVQNFYDRSTQSQLMAFVKKVFCRTYKAEFQPRYKVVPTPGLVAAVHALPATYNYTDYVKFLEDWGTHYVYSVEMGGGYYSESWMKSSAVTELTRLGVDTRLAMGLQKPGGPIPFLSELPNFDFEFKTKTGKDEQEFFAQSCTESRSYNMGGDGPIDGNLEAWARSVPNKPQPVKASVRSLLEFFKEPITDPIKGEHFARAQLDYLRDGRQQPPDRLNTRNNRLSYDGDASLRFGAVFAPYNQPSEELGPYTVSANSTALDLRWQVSKWPRDAGQAGDPSEAGFYRVAFDKDLTDGVTLATALGTNIHEMNELPDYAQAVAPFAVQNSVYIAAQDSTGFVAKMNMMHVDVGRMTFPGHFSFISAVTTLDEDKVGIIAGAVTKGGIKVFQDYGTDTHFESYSWGTKGVYTLKLDNTGTRPLVVATAYGELTKILGGTNPSPDKLNPSNRVGVFVSEVAEDCCQTCLNSQCNDPSLVNIRTIRGANRVWQGDGAPTTPMTAGFNFLALTKPGYKGPNGELTWGGVRFKNVANSADPNYEGWVVGVRLHNFRVDTPPFTSVETVVMPPDETHMVDEFWGAGMYYGNRGSGDWTIREEYTKIEPEETSPWFFHGIRITLKGPRYLDVPGIIVTPVLSDIKDTQQVEVPWYRPGDLPRNGWKLDLTGTQAPVTGGIGGITCSADWNDAQDGNGQQNVMVLCYDRLTGARFPTTGLGRYTIVGFNFVVAGSRESS